MAVRWTFRSSGRLRERRIGGRDVIFNTVGALRTRFVGAGDSPDVIILSSQVIEVAGEGEPLRAGQQRAARQGDLRRCGA